ncbi:MAG: Mut7-C RNAse domain-containing protein, partial [Candidatus Bathyarchaeia archaeon]
MFQLSIEPRFVVDGMLGGLSRWLRMLGYEAYYSNNASDDVL